MSKEIDADVIEDVVEVDELKPTLDENGNDITDWKAVAEARHAQAVKNQGIATRFKTKATKAKEAPANPAPKKDDAPSNDLGEKAFLAVNGIKTAKQIEFFQKMKKETGKSADALLETTYFQQEFKNFNEREASADATPSGNKRSGNSAIDTVEYWLAKGELPPADQVDLRRKVVNARMKKEDSKGPFYNS